MDSPSSIFSARVGTAAPSPQVNRVVRACVELGPGARKSNLEG